MFPTSSPFKTLGHQPLAVFEEVRERLGDGSLLEEVGHWGEDLRL